MLILLANSLIACEDAVGEHGFRQPYQYWQAASSSDSHARITAAHVHPRRAVRRVHSLRSECCARSRPCWHAEVCVHPHSRNQALQTVDRLPRGPSTVYRRTAFTIGRYCTILKLNSGVCNAPIRRSQIGSSISVPRAVVMSPTSMISRQPKLFSSSATCAFAPASLPLTKTV